MFLLFYMALLNTPGLKLTKKIQLEFLGDPAKIYAFVQDEVGNSYLTVLGTPQILVYDNAGKERKPIGKRGQGPGEFEYPMAMTYARGFLYMLDDGRRLMYKINPATSTIEKEWQMAAATKIQIQNDNVVIGFYSPLRKGMFGLTKLGDKLDFKETFFSPPESIDVPGSKTAGLTFDDKGNVWAAYSGIYMIVKVTAGKIVKKITTPPEDYVAPTSPGNRYNPRAATANYRSFDKMKGLFWVNNQVVLYRNKSYDNGRLDIYDSNGGPIKIGIYMSLVVPFQVINNRLHGYKVTSEDQVEVVELAW